MSLCKVDKGVRHASLRFIENQEWVDMEGNVKCRMMLVVMSAKWVGVIA